MSNTTSPTGIVLDAISQERKRQDELKQAGKFTHTCADDIDNGRKLAILTEELGEVARAMCDKEPKERLREELIQVAAVATAWAEALL